MNLREIEVKKRSFPIRPIVMSVTGFLLTVIVMSLNPHQPVEKVTEMRSLEIEEKETVLFTLHELEMQFPEMRKGFGNVGLLLQMSDRNAMIDPLTKSPLVRIEQDTLVFSPRFFRSDTNAQEDSLADSLSSMHPPSEPSDANDLARK